MEGTEFIHTRLRSSGKNEKDDLHPTTLPLLLVLVLARETGPPVRQQNDLSHDSPLGGGN